MKKKYLWLGMAILLITGAAVFGWWKRGERLRFVAAMGSGINIGNTLDSTNLWEHDPTASELDDEIYWGNPKITKELLHSIKEAGFGSVRIPVTWQDHIDTDGTISGVWMERVTEVVDMALGEELYVVLNTHHEDWLDLKTGQQNEICARYEKVWRQIAEHFADYDNHLLFEGMNEPRLRDSEHEWDEGTKDLRNMINRLNAVFVDTVRATGGNNKSRYVLITPYAANTKEEALEELDIPRGNVIVSVHMYQPYSFCQDEEGTAEWSDEDVKSREEIEHIFAGLERLFIKKKIPVIITEYGCRDKNNEEARIRWISFCRKLAGEAGIPCMWWDNGSTYKVLDRQTGAWTEAGLARALTESVQKKECRREESE